MTLTYHPDGKAAKTMSKNISEEYLTALQKYWSGQGAETIEYVSTLIAEKAEDADIFNFYRLWIEALADSEDRPSLRKMADHLTWRGRMEPEELGQLTALRGIVHLELDEIEAATLLSSATSSENNHLYGQELLLRLSMREKNPDELYPKFCEIQAMDYFFWQTLARFYLAQNLEKELSIVLQHISQIFPSAPLPGIFRLHQHLDHKNHHEAILEADRLIQLYPDQQDFYIFGAYARLLAGDEKSAINTLTSVMNKLGSNDPDLLTLLGYCYSALTEKKRDKLCLDKAISYLKKATCSLKNAGLPACWPGIKLQYLNDLKDSESSDPARLEDIQPARIWMIKLSPRRCHELQTSSENSIRHLLRPMGSSPRPGDLCFFAADEMNRSSDNSDSRWRIVAIYAVVSEPMWHPQFRSVTALRLESRPTDTIPVDVCLLDAEQAAKNSKLPKDHPFRYGVFELEEGAWGIITEAIRQRNTAVKYNPIEGDMKITLCRPS